MFIWNFQMQFLQKLPLFFNMIKILVSLSTPIREYQTITKILFKDPFYSITSYSCHHHPETLLIRYCTPSFFPLSPWCHLNKKHCLMVSFSPLMCNASLAGADLPFSSSNWMSEPGGTVVCQLWQLKKFAWTINNKSTGWANLEGPLCVSCGN